VSEENQIQVNSKFIEKLFSLAGEQVPENVELKDLEAVLGKIRDKLNTPAPVAAASPETAEEAGVDTSRLKTVLVVDDLGIVTMQLAALLKKFNFEVTTSRELYDAIKKYKTQDFGYAVVDLFIPTEREGFILIDEIKKLSLLCRLDTKIIVMSASNKKEHKDKCKSKGAHIFIEKTQGWQEKIIDFVTGKSKS